MPCLFPLKVWRKRLHGLATPDLEAALEACVTALEVCVRSGLTPKLVCTYCSRRYVWSARSPYVVVGLSDGQSCLFFFVTISWLNRGRRCSQARVYCRMLHPATANLPGKHSIAAVKPVFTAECPIPRQPTCLRNIAQQAHGQQRLGHRAMQGERDTKQITYFL